MRKKLMILAALFAMVCSLSACFSPTASLTLVDDEVTLKVGNTKNLSVVVLPVDEMSRLIWSSSNENVVKVENGMISAVGEGEAKVTVATFDGLKSTCSVKVDNDSIPKPAVVTDETKPSETGGDKERLVIPRETQAPAETGAEVVSESATAAPVNDIDVEAEVALIRERYYSTQNDPGLCTETDGVQRFTKNGSVTKIVIPQMTDGWIYERWYFFDNDELYFAFIYRGREEHRLYFKDNTLIRYIDQNGNTSDYPKFISCPFESRAVEEAYRQLG